MVVKDCHEAAVRVVGGMMLKEKKIEMLENYCV